MAGLVARVGRQERECDLKESLLFPGQKDGGERKVSGQRDTGGRGQAQTS